ncbi:MAG: hypothetical protein KDK55_06115 [Chlamydiia bacterium]|nr:hypothetical protein [Chlamydiia bacterium]
MSVNFFPFVFIVQLAVTLLISGLVFAFQLGYYPLFKILPQDLFKHVMEIHNKKINPLFVSFMLLEFLTAIWLPLIANRLWIVIMLWIGFAILVVIWLISIFCQVIMTRLKGKNPIGIAETLIQMNWVRTVLWVIRSTLLLIIADWFIIISYFESLK